MAKIEDKVLLDRIRSSGKVSESIIVSVIGAYEQLQKVGETVSLYDVFLKKGVLPEDLVKSIGQLTSASKKIGGYLLLKRLGSGGMGSVFLCQTEGDTKKVALKVLPKQQNNNEKSVNRFNREFKALKQLSHPFIVGAIEKGFADGYHFYVMDYDEGDTLRKFIEKNPQANVNTYIHFLRQLIEGLSYAHQLGVIHRDIKPDNILITSDGKVKIIDFGLAKIENEDSLGLTRSATALGTPHFISTEQAKNAKYADLRSDIYSLGATLYYCLTKEYPVKGTTAYEILANLISEEIIPAKEIQSDISEELNYIIEKMMKKDPSQRYQNYDELLKDLDQLDQGTLNILHSTSSQQFKPIFITAAVVCLAFMIWAIYSFFASNSNQNIPENQVADEFSETIKTESKPQETIEEQKQDLATDQNNDLHKYRISSAFDWEIKKDRVPSKYALYLSKLDEIVEWASKKTIIEGGDFNEQLLVRALLIQAICGAGHDFLTSPYKVELNAALEFLLKTQKSPGVWTEQFGINELVNFTVLTSFELMGGEDEKLELMCKDGAYHLSRQIKSVDINVLNEFPLGYHHAVLFYQLLTRSRVSKPYYAPDEEAFRGLMRGFFQNFFEEIKEDKKVSVTTLLDLEATILTLGGTRKNNLVLESIKKMGVNKESILDVYYVTTVFGIASNKEEHQWLFDEVNSFHQKSVPLNDLLKEYPLVNGQLISNCIWAISLSHLYKYQGTLMPKRGVEKMRLKDKRGKGGSFRNKASD